MNKSEREVFERMYAQTERQIEVTARLAAAQERTAHAQEVLARIADPSFIPVAW